MDIVMEKEKTRLSETFADKLRSRHLPAAQTEVPETEPDTEEKDTPFQLRAGGWVKPQILKCKETEFQPTGPSSYDFKFLGLTITAVWIMLCTIGIFYISLTETDAFFISKFSFLGSSTGMIEGNTLLAIGLIGIIPIGLTTLVQKFIDRKNKKAEREFKAALKAKAEFEVKETLAEGQPLIKKSARLLSKVFKTPVALGIPLPKAENGKTPEDIDIAFATKKGVFIVDVDTRDLSKDPSINNLPVKGAFIDENWDNYKNNTLSSGTPVKENHLRISLLKQVLGEQYYREIAIIKQPFLLSSYEGPIGKRGYTDSEEDGIKMTADYIYTKNTSSSRIIDAVLTTAAYPAEKTYGNLADAFSELPDVYSDEQVDELNQKLMTIAKFSSDILNDEPAKTRSDKDTCPTVSTDPLTGAEKCLFELSVNVGYIPIGEVRSAAEEAENAASAVLSYLKENPEKISSASRTLSYYIPSAASLAKKYSKAISSRIEMKKEDRAAIDAEAKEGFQLFAKALKSQYQKLSVEDRIDLSSDVSVLKKIMELEGDM